MAEFNDEYQQVVRDLESVIRGLEEDATYLRGQDLVDENAWDRIKREMDRRLKNSRAELDNLIRPL